MRQRGRSGAPGLALALLALFTLLCAQCAGGATARASASAAWVARGVAVGPPPGAGGPRRGARRGCGTACPGGACAATPAGAEGERAQRKKRQMLRVRIRIMEDVVRRVNDPALNYPRKRETVSELEGYLRRMRALTADPAGNGSPEAISRWPAVQRSPPDARQRHAQQAQIGQALSRMRAAKAVAVLRGRNPQRLVARGLELALCGCTCMEVTLDSPEAMAVLRILAEQLPDSVLLGAATAMGRGDAAAAISSGPLPAPAAAPASGGTGRFRPPARRARVAPVWAGRACSQRCARWCLCGSAHARGPALKRVSETGAAFITSPVAASEIIPVCEEAGVLALPAGDSSVPPASVSRCCCVAGRAAHAVPTHPVARHRPDADGDLLQHRCGRSRGQGVSCECRIAGGAQGHTAAGSLPGHAHHGRRGHPAAGRPRLARGGRGHCGDRDAAGGR